MLISLRSSPNDPIEPSWLLQSYVKNEKTMYIVRLDPHRLCLEASPTIAVLSLRRCRTDHGGVTHRQHTTDLNLPLSSSHLPLDKERVDRGKAKGIPTSTLLRSCGLQARAVILEEACLVWDLVWTRLVPVEGILLSVDSRLPDTAM